MTCRELIDLLADDALGAPAQTTFDAHLADCPACVEYVRSYRETIRLAQDACAPPDDDATTTPAERAAEIPAEIIDAILAATPRRRGR